MTIDLGSVPWLGITLGLLTGDVLVWVVMGLVYRKIRRDRSKDRPDTGHRPGRPNIRLAKHRQSRYGRPPVVRAEDWYRGA